jgi:hypothetical protein
VTGGAVVLSAPASTVQIGLGYTHIVEPLPPNVIAESGAGRKIRMIKGIFRLHDTAALRLDTGRGVNDITLRQLGEEDILDAPLPLVSGDISVRALGWQNAGTQSLWRIEQASPLPFTLLSVITELNVND